MVDTLVGKHPVRMVIDGASRRRLYLFRHGAVDYIDDNGDWVADPDLVDLNERGRAQAAAMSELFAGVHVDKALCSGFPRTVQTGRTILGSRDLKLEIVAELQEIRGIVRQERQILQKWIDDNGIRVQVDLEQVVVMFQTQQHLN